MISMPIWVFVLLVLSSVGHIILIAWWIIGRRIDRKEYHRYLEEEYGKHKKE